MNILDLLRENQIESKHVAETNGGEWAGPCPACGGKDRFHTWPQKDRYWCRVCGEKGDSIQYLRTFRGMTYFDACEHLGREPKVSFSDRCTAPSKPKWEPKQPQEPAALWRKQATKFFEYSVSQLWSEAGEDTLEWLKSERGFTEETIMASRLGWNPQDLWRYRSTWGLPEVLKEDGKPKKLWIPAGLVILTGNPVSRIKIRRPEPGDGPRYYLLPGSTTQAMTCGPDMSVLVVLESELDALLVHQDAGNGTGAIALGSSVMRPDSMTTELLRSAKLILVALDSDGAGAKESWLWWRENFPEARRWPPVGGKDPGEMRQAGVSISAWIEAGIEEYSNMAPPEQQAPSMAKKAKEAKKGHRTFDGEVTEETDLFLYLHNSISTGGPYRKLWPQIRSYIRSQLPGELFRDLEELFRAILARETSEGGVAA